MHEWFYGRSSHLSGWPFGELFFNLLNVEVSLRQAAVIMLSAGHLSQPATPNPSPITFIITSPFSSILFLIITLKWVYCWLRWLCNQWSIWLYLQIYPPRDKSSQSSSFHLMMIQNFFYLLLCPITMPLNPCHSLCKAKTFRHKFYHEHLPFELKLDHFSIWGLRAF